MASDKPGKHVFLKLQIIIIIIRLLAHLTLSQELESIRSIVNIHKSQLKKGRRIVRLRKSKSYKKAHSKVRDVNGLK